MRFPFSPRTLLGSTALLAMTAAASAQSADEIAERLTSLIEGEGMASATFQSADEEGSATVIGGLEVISKEGDGGDTFTAETVRIEEAELTANEGIDASRIFVTNGRLISTNWGEATIAEAEGTTLSIVPKGAEGQTDNAAGAVESGIVRNVTIDPDESEPFTIASISFDQGDYVDSVATRRSLDIQDIVLARGAFGADSDEIFDYLGVDEITVDVSGSGQWNTQTNVLTIDDARISGDDIGTFSIDLELGGVTQTTFEQMETSPVAALSTMTLAELAVNLEAGDLIDQAVEIRAESMGVTSRELRESTLASVGPMLAIFGESAFRQSMERALDGFVSGDSDRFTITAMPSTPVPILAIGLASQTDPTSLPGLLSLTAEAN